jgi:hypothetical protein
VAEKKKNVPAVSSTADSRFNATKHGILSRHTVLPWEDAQEYRELYEALIEEYAPSGPTQGHLVEELAGIMWRKQRLRMAEAGAARDSLSQLLIAQVKSERSQLIDLDLFGQQTAEIAEGRLSQVTVPPDQASANLDKIEDQLSEEYVENRAELEEQRDFLKRYREMHEAVQSNVASGVSFEKLARYETHLDRKFERTLTMLLRMQEFRNRAVAVASDRAD